MIPSSVRCGVEIVNTVEVHQYVIFACSKSHIKGSLEKIGREYGLQPELLTKEIEHSVINESELADLGHLGAISYCRCIMFSFYL